MNMKDDLESKILDALYLFFQNAEPDDRFTRESANVCRETWRRKLHEFSESAV